MEDRMDSCWHVQVYSMGTNKFSDSVFGILPIQLLAWLVCMNILQT